MPKKPVLFKFNCDRSLYDIMHEKIQDGNNLIVFPSVQIKLMYITQYFDDQLFNTFITMEDLKAVLFIQNKSLIKGNRRIIALYSVCIDLLQKCNCKNFYDFVSFAIKYLQFMDECCEELIDIGSIKTLKEVVLNPIQIGDCGLFEEIQKRYKALCDSINYTDKMFMSNEIQNKDYLLQFKDSNKAFIISPYKFSKREELIVNEIADIFKHSEVLQQDVDFNKHINTSVQIHKDINSFMSFMSISDEISTTENCIIIDSIKNKTKYYQLLNHDLLGSVNKSTFSQTPIYELLSVLMELTKTAEFTFEMKIQASLLLKALSNVFIEKFYGLINDKHFLQEKIINYINEGNIYVRESDGVLGKKGKLQSIWNDIQEINACKNMQDCASFLAKIPSTIATSSNFNDFIENNVAGSDWLTQSCEIVFEFIEEIKSLDAFTSMISRNKKDNNESFGTQKQNISDFFSQQTSCSGSFLFIYILEFIALKEIKNNTKNSKIRFLTLRDAFGLYGNHIIISNAVEGILPKAKEQVILLNDEQRHVLGLKTNNVIREEEKYYFILSILNNKEVTIFTYEDKDNSVSSFVEELVLNKNFFHIKEYDHIKENTRSLIYTSLYKEILLPNSKKIWSNAIPDFLLIPFTLQLREYIKKNNLKISYYAYKGLIKESASFFLQFIAELKPISFEKIQGITPLLLGKIVHDIFAQINEKLSFSKDSSPIGLIKSVLQSFISDCKTGKQYYCDFFPDIMSLNYFIYVIYPTFENAFIHFYLELQKIVNSTSVYDEKQIDIISDNKNAEKEIEIPGNSEFHHVTMRGRADLIVHERNFDVIVDYKTGAFKPEDKDQLEWYSMLYRDYFDKTYTEKEKPYISNTLSNNKTGRNIFGVIYYLFSGFEEGLETNRVGSGDDLLLDLENTLMEIVEKKGFFISDIISKQDKNYKPLYLVKSINKDQQENKSVNDKKIINQESREDDEL